MMKNSFMLMLYYVIIEKIRETLKVHNLIVTLVRIQKDHWEIVETSLSSNSIRITRFYSRIDARKDFLLKKKLLKKKKR